MASSESAPYTLTVRGVPVLSGLYVSDRQPRSYELRFATDQGGTTAYWIATRNPASPTPEQIRDGDDAGGIPASARGEQAVSAPGTQPATEVAPLLPATTYYNFIVQQAADGVGWSNVASMAGQTLADPGVGTGRSPLVSFYKRDKALEKPDFGGSE